MAAEFEKARIQMQDHLVESANSFGAGWNSFNQAEEQYNAMSSLRDAMLQEILEQRGLAICAQSHLPDRWSEPSEEKEPTLESEGIYPKDKMRIYFQQEYFYRHGQDPGGDNWGMNPSISLLCPEHYPNKENKIVPPPEDGKGREPGFKKTPNVYSEVTRNEEGRLILQVNGQDITDLVNSLDWYSQQHEGRKVPGDRAYLALEIPDLPERPEFKDVQYGSRNTPNEIAKVAA